MIQVFKKVIMMILFILGIVIGIWGACTIDSENMFVPMIMAYGGALLAYLNRGVL